MTKLNSKKMSKSTFAVIIMAIAMVALLAFGGTYAYFTANTSASGGTVTLGKVSLKSGGSFATSATLAVPGQTILENASVSYIDESTVNTYIVVEFSVKYTGKAWDATNSKTKDLTNYDLTADEIEEAFGANALAIDDAKWIAGTTNTNVYALKLNDSFVIPAGEGDETFISQANLTLSSNLNRNFVDGVWTGTADNQLQWEDSSIVISVKAYSIQAKGFESATDTDKIWEVVSANAAA